MKENYLEELITRANKAMGKKLSTRDREKLRTSQFCGPGRSFPVSDCSHYTAALRMLNRSKFSDSTKAKIKSCIMRKGKGMGCTKKEKSGDIDVLMASDVFKETLMLVEESEKNPGMDLDFELIDIEN